MLSSSIWDEKTETGRGSVTCSRPHSQQHSGETHSGFKAGCSRRAQLSSTLTHVPRCQEQSWKDSHWPTACLLLQMCSEYLFFTKVIGNCGYVFAGGLILLLKGKTRFTLKTWHWFWLTPHRKLGLLTKFCWSKWNKGQKLQHSVRDTVVTPGCLQMFMETFRSNPWGDRRAVYCWISSHFLKSWFQALIPTTSLAASWGNCSGKYSLGVMCHPWAPARVHTCLPGSAY